MGEVLLRFLIQRDSDVIKVRRFRSEKEKVYFKLPDHLQDKEKHPELFTYTPIVRAETACVENRFYRHVTVKMSEEHAALYVDETGNPFFSDTSLEEDENQTEKSIASRQQPADPSEGGSTSTPSAQDDSFWTLRVSELEAQLKAFRNLNVADVEKKFVLSLFDGTEDAGAWFEKFEAECDRYGITDRLKRVEALGKMMKTESKAQDWYDNSLKKLSHATQWSTWKASFTKVFATKNWQPVRDAHRFKYSDGPLIDYGLRKEKKVLLADPGSSQKSMINAIVMGLPESIQDQLERKQFVLVNDLLEKLGAMSVPSSATKWTREKRSNNEARSPCPYCAAKGFTRRFHRLEECREKRKDQALEKSSKAKKPKASVNFTAKQDAGSSSEESSEDEKFAQMSSLN